MKANLSAKTNSADHKNSFLSRFCLHFCLSFVFSFISFLNNHHSDRAFHICLFMWSWWWLRWFYYLFNSRAWNLGDLSKVKSLELSLLSRNKQSLINLFITTLSFHTMPTDRKIAEHTMDINIRAMEKCCAWKSWVDEMEIRRNKIKKYLRLTQTQRQWLESVEHVKWWSSEDEFKVVQRNLHQHSRLRKASENPEIIFSTWLRWADERLTCSFLFAVAHHRRAENFSLID